MKPAEWKVLIADDEPAARRGVRQLLAAFPEFEIAGECRNGAEVLAALDVSAPDVIFLDIHMPGIDGFEVVFEAFRRCTPERMPEVVFLTAYDQFALRAFEAEALDYLVKPVSEARFAATIKRLLKRLRSAARATEDERLVVTTTRGAIVLNVSDIDWIEAAGNYAQLWVGARSYIHRESLQVLEARLHKHGFIRAHRSALVRLDGVRELKRDREGILVAVLGSGVRISISRRRSAGFSAALRQLGGARIEE